VYELFLRAINLPPELRMCTKLILSPIRANICVEHTRDSVGQTNILNTLIVITIFELGVRENEKIFLRHKFYAFVWNLENIIMIIIIMVP
jgi:hypothetical protein